MKRLKRLAALALSAVLTLSLAAPAFATEGDLTAQANLSLSSGYKGKIIVMDAVGSRNYTAYRLLELQLVTENSSLAESRGLDVALPNNKTYIYSLSKDSPWLNFFKEGAGKDYFTVSDTPDTKGEYIVQPTALLQDEMDAAKLAKAAMAAIKDGTVTVASDQTIGGWSDAAGSKNFYALELKTYAPTADTITDPEDLGQIGGSQTGYIASSKKGIPLGYYLVDAGTGALCGMDSTDTTAIIYDKSVQPSMVKEIWTRDGAPDYSDYFSDSGWGKANDANVGDDLYYRITITLGSNANLTLKDLMDRMTIDYNDMEVYYKSVEGETSPLTEGTDYCLYTNDPIVYPTGDEGADRRALYNRYDHTLPMFYSFGFAFSNDLTDTRNPGDAIVITYKATLDSDAYLAGNGDAAGVLINESGRVNRLEAQYNNAVLGSSGLDRDAFEYKVANDGRNSEWPRFGNGDEVDMGKRPDMSGMGITFYDSNGNEVIPNGWTPIASSGTATFLYGFDLMKVNKDQKLIQGATFELYSSNPDTDLNAQPISLEQVANKYGWLENATDSKGNPLKEYGPQGPVYRFARGGGTTEITVGFATIVGLDSGDYWVKEVNAPSGYTKMAKAQKITLVSAVSAWRDAGLGENSGIRDTEMVEYTQNSILAQAGQAMSGSSGYRVNRAGDDNAGLAISEKYHSQIRGLSQAYKNLCPIVVEGVEGYNLTSLGYPANCTTAMALCHKGVDGEWYYGSDGTVALQIGASAGQTLGGTNSNYSSDPVIYGGLSVVNLTGIELPHTGGMGTTLFYVVGGVLVVGAGILLIVKKRMKNEE